MLLKKNALYILLAVMLASCARPVAKFSYDMQKNRVPTKVSFKNMSEKADSYVWDFGDGNTSTVANPVHMFLLSGKHTVKLTAIKEGNSKTITKEIVLKAPKECYVMMETTEGDMLIHLYDDTPEHRDNFLKLAEDGFYEDLLFHRVIDGFMVQGGDPTSKKAVPGQRLGSGGPGYTISAEFQKDNVHYRGALAAARQGDVVNPEKRSSGSQFYIVDGKPVDDDILDKMAARNGIQYAPEVRKLYKELGGTPFLDHNYTVYGMVVEGLEVIDRICGAVTDGADRPKQDIKIKSVKVIK